MSLLDASRPLRVIAVDDARTNLIMLGAILRAEGCEPRLTSDAAEAVAMATADRPDLVLLDLMMPGVDGIALCSQLQAPAVALGCPILRLTARVLRQWLAAARAGSRAVPPDREGR